MHQLLIPLLLLTLYIVVAAYVALKSFSEAEDRLLRGLEAIHESIADFEFPERDVAEAVEDPRVAAIEARLSELTIAVDTGVNRVQRAENRVRAIIQGARKELEEHGYEHAGVEAEASQLRDIDAGGGDPEPVRAVPAGVEVVGQTPSSIPGISVEQMRRARSYH